MKVIKDLSESIEKELDCAEHYVKLAFAYKEDFPDASRVFLNRSLARLDDVKALHDQVVSLISTYRSKTGEPPAPMMAIYDYMHERQIEQAAGIKRLQEMYKTGN